MWFGLWVAGCGGFSLSAPVRGPKSVTLLDGTSIETISQTTPVPNEEEPSISLVADEQCANPCTFSAQAVAVERVRYEADGWLLGEVTADQGFEITYTFNQTGLRYLSAIGLGADGGELARDERYVEVLSQVSADWPYFYQYANVLYPSSTCQNTSIAMVLAGLGWSEDPDFITSYWGKDYAQSPAGLADVFNVEAAYAGMSERLIPHTDGSISGLKQLLDRGDPVIVHGMFTGAGHVMVVLGYDATGYFCNDPAGAWAETFTGGYLGPYDDRIGAGIHYPTAAFEQAISTLDGWTYEPLWYHELVR